MSRGSLEVRGTMFETQLSIKLQNTYQDTKFIHSKKIITDLYREGDTEIDLIMVHPKGIFVIEAKKWTQSISGNLTEIKWNGVSSNRKRMNVINTFHQNFNHIRLLKNAIRVQNVEPVDMHSIICVPDSCVIESDCNNIVNLSYLCDHIDNLINRSVVSVDVAEYERLIRKAK